MLNLEVIAEFARSQTGYRKSISENADFDQDIGVFADDTDDLLEAYAERFGVDMKPYL